MYSIVILVCLVEVLLCHVRSDGNENLINLLSNDEVRILGKVNEGRLITLFVESTPHSELSVYDIPATNIKRNWINMFGLKYELVKDKWPNISSNSIFHEQILSGNFTGALSMNLFTEMSLLFITNIISPSEVQVEALLCSLSTEQVKQVSYSVNYFPSPVNSVYITSIESNTFYVLEQGIASLTDKYSLFKYTVDQSRLIQVQVLLMCQHSDDQSNTNETFKVSFEWNDSNASSTCGTIRWKFHRAAFSDGGHFVLFDVHWVYMFPQKAVDNPSSVVSLTRVSYSNYVRNIAPIISTNSTFITTNGTTTVSMKTKFPLVAIISIVVVGLLLIGILFGVFWSKIMKKNKTEPKQSLTTAETYYNSADPYLQTNIKADYYFMTKTRSNTRKRSKDKKKNIKKKLNGAAHKDCPTMASTSKDESYSGKRKHVKASGSSQAIKQAQRIVAAYLESSKKTRKQPKPKSAKTPTNRSNKKKPPIEVCSDISATAAPILEVSKKLNTSANNKRKTLKQKLKKLKLKTFNNSSTSAANSAALGVSDFSGVSGLPQRDPSKSNKNLKKKGKLAKLMMIKEKTSRNKSIRKSVSGSKKSNKKRNKKNKSRSKRSVSKKSRSTSMKGSSPF